MKKLINVIIVIALPFLIKGQDIFRSNLYDAEAIIEYKEEIGLNEKQEKDIKQIYLESNQVFMEKKWELNSLNKKMSALLSESKVDKSAADAMLREILDLENEIKILKLSTLVDIKNILNEDQQAKLDPYVDGSTGFFTSDIFMGTDYEVKLKVKEKAKDKSKAQPVFIIKNNGEEYVMKSYGPNDVNPKEIEAISVIKGENAIRIYGDKGKNGVILISVPAKTYQRIKSADQK